MGADQVARRADRGCLSGKERADGFGDAFGGAAVAVGVVHVGAAIVFGGVIEEERRFGEDALRVGADEACSSGVDGFGPFGFLAHDEDGFAERGGFFLNAAGVGEDEVAAAHEVDEGDVFLGRDEVDVGESGEELVDGVLDVGVGVDRVDNFDVRASGEGMERLADAEEALAEAFAAVAGDEDHLAGGDGRVGKRRCGDAAVFEGGFNVEQGVDAGVAGDGDLGIGDGFGSKIGGGHFGGREVEGGEAGGEDAIHFLGEGLGHVAGAESGFDVADGDALVEGGEGAAEGGGGIALDEDEGWLFVAEDGFEGGEDTGGGLEEGLAGEHDVEVMVWGDGEDLEDLVKEGAVLGGDADADGEEVGEAAEVEDGGAEFDGFGASAEDEKDFERGHEEGGRYTVIQPYRAIIKKTGSRTGASDR